MMITRLFEQFHVIFTYEAVSFFMVHPEYANICMRVRIIYVECKNNENKYFKMNISWTFFEYSFINIILTLSK